MIGLGDDEAIEQRIEDAIADLLTKQTSSGGFGLWGPFSAYRPVARLLCHRVPAPRQGRGLRRAGAGADPGARQPRQPGVLRHRLRRRRRGHRLRALRPGACRPGRHRRPALLSRGAARRLRHRRSPRPSSVPRSPSMATAPVRPTAFEAAVADLQVPEKTAALAIGPTTAASCATRPACSRSPPSSRPRASISRALTDASSPTCATTPAGPPRRRMRGRCLPPRRSPARAADGTVTVDGEAAHRRGLSPLRRRSTSTSGAGGDRQHRQPADRDEGHDHRHPGDAAGGQRAKASPSSGLLPARRRRRPTSTDVQPERPLRGGADDDADELGSGQYVVADPLPAGFEIENPNLRAGLGRG